MSLPVAESVERYTPERATPTESCATCGEPIATPFCAACGERRASDRPRTLSAHVDELWDAFSPADGRMARTLWSLVRRPGELTVEYMRGARLRWVPPLRLFLLVNVLYFVMASVTHDHAFDTPLNVHLHRSDHQTLAQQFVARRLAERHLTFERYAPVFDRESTTQAKSLVLVMVPAFAVVLAVLGVRRRRPMLHHLAFALHTYCVLLLAALASTLAIGRTYAWLVRRGYFALSWDGWDGAVTLGLVTLLGTWLWFGFRRAYGDGRVWATLKVPIAILAIAWILFRYRLLLFFTVYFTT